MDKEGETNSAERAKEASPDALKLVLGNDLGRLADSLGRALFSSSSRPFDNRLVVVPNASFKDFLFRRFAAHPELNMAACVQVLPLNQAVMEILDSGSAAGNRKRIPSFLELSLAVEEKLHFFASGQHTDPLSEYLDLCEEEKKCKRTSALSDELARLFSRYGLYGRNFLPEWLAQEGWQQTLWKDIFSESSPWTYPLQSLAQTRGDCFQGKVALFGFSYLSLAHLTFFSGLDASIYQLSPCALFWEDHSSDKERLSTQRFLQRKRVKDKVRIEIDGYMLQSHPLLGNWGKLGREMLKSLDAFILKEEEVYLDISDQRLLGVLKESLLNLDEEKALKADDSIQLHSATSKFREVEILRDALETLLQKHTASSDPIRPRDILVVMPDIASYAPYIHMVFDQSSFSFVIDGLPLSSTSAAVQGFLQLFRLTQERFELSSVEKLLRCPPFMEKWGFAFDELNQISKWLKTAQVRRGLSGGPNSWEEGIDRLLFGLAVVPNDDLHFENWPIACVPHSEIDLFNRFLSVFSELKNDLLELDTRRSVSKWMETFLYMADKYFSFQWEIEPFFQEIKSLALSCRSLSEEVWDFNSIFRVLHRLGEKPSGRISSSHLEKITFAPLSDSSIGSARIIWCLGMDEGAFPRSDSRSSLCEMTKWKASDYYPHKSDEDRGLFLEMVIKAQDYLIFSYLRLNAEDAKHQGPSLLIEELDQYLGKRGLKEGVLKVDHPAFPFDSVYFSKDAKVKKWHWEDFLAAKAHYFPSHQRVSFFQGMHAKENEEEKIVIDIRQLKKLARNPFQFYFNETLKIFLNEEEDEEETEFLISHLRKSVLRKRALQKSLPQLLKQMNAQGKMPRGLFHDAAIRELEEELKDIKVELDGFGIRSEEIFSIRFLASCRQSEMSNTLLPPLVIPLKDSRVAHIIGLLENVSSHGLIAHAEGDLKSLVKLWPSYLIYRCIDPKNRLLLLTKKGKEIEFTLEDPKSALADYIEYYLFAKQTPSPLMPEWSKAILAEGVEGLKKVMGKEASFVDPYLNYLKRRNGLSDVQEIFSQWSDCLRKTFAPILQGGNDAL